MNTPIILTIGELLWDCFPDSQKLGGAPANVAVHAAALGAKTYLVSAVGNDPLGARAIKALRQRGVQVDFISQLKNYPTGTVEVSTHPDKSHSFRIVDRVAWDHLEVSDALVQLTGKADALVFGTLAQRSPENLSATLRLLKAAGSHTVRVCDANFRPPYDSHSVLHQLLPHIDVLKINDEELAAFAPGRSPQDFFYSQKQLSHLVYTRGAKGALILSRDGESDLPCEGAEVVDTVGAGDSFTATFIVDILRGVPIDRINKHASEIAAYVCSQAGATPALPSEFLQEHGQH